MLNRNLASAGSGLALVVGLLATGAPAASAADVVASADPAFTALTFHGGRTDQELGHTLNADACDLDADGHADLTAGSAVNLGSDAYADMPAYRRAVAGHADSTVDLPHWWSYSLQRSAGGWTCVPDVNGDGFDDLLQLPPASSRVLSLNQSAATRNDAGRPAEHRARNYQFPQGTSNLAATAAASAGDLDGDGVDDVVVSQHTAGTAGRVGNGRLWVLAGVAGPTVPASVSSVALAATGNDPATVSLVIDGAAAGDALGTARSVGDVDGDGLDDLMVASANAGKVWLIHGRAATGTPREVDLAALAPEDGRLWVTGDAGLGASLGVADDIDGDGTQDYLLGAARSATEDGGVAVVLGDLGAQPVTVDAAAGTVATAAGAQGYWISPERDGDGLGHSVAGLGDINGDGRSDLLVGAPGHDPADPASSSARLSDAGAAYVLYGRAGSSAQRLAGFGEADGERIDGILGEGQPAARPSYLGHRVARVGDVDGNGVEDFAISAPGRSDHASYRHGGVVVALRGELATDLTLAVSRRVGDGGEAVTGQGREIAATDHLDLRANLRLSTLQGTAGQVSFALDGDPVPGCADVAAVPSQPHRSYAHCETGLQLAEYGVHDLEAEYAGRTGRHGAARSERTTLYVADTSTTTLRATGTTSGGTELTATVTPDSSQQVVQGGTVTFTGPGPDGTGQPVAGCVDVAVVAGRATCALPTGTPAEGHRAGYSGLSVEKAGAPGTRATVLAASTAALSADPTVTTVGLRLSRTSLQHGDAVTASVSVDAASSADAQILVDGKVVAAAPLTGRATTIALPRTLAVGTRTVVARTLAGDAWISSAAVGLRVGKASVGAVRVSAPRFARGTRPRVTVRVGRLSNGSLPVGKVVVRAGGRAQRVSLAAAARGRVSVRLSRKARAAVRVKVSFVPASPATVAAPRAVVKKLRPRT